MINSNGKFDINDFDMLQKTYKYVLQPKLELKKEAKFCYTLEFIPSKGLIYLDAKYYKYTDKELLLAQNFANLNYDFIGVQRIDFLKDMNNEIILLEIEDVSPYLDLDCLSKSDLNSFLNEYKSVVYEFVNLKLEEKF